LCALHLELFTKPSFYDFYEIINFRTLQGKEEEDSKGPMATAELRLGMPKKVVVLSLDTPGRL
jgi:hypothetical protein